MDRDYRKYIPNVPSPLRKVCVPHISNPEFCAILVTSLDPSIALKDIYDHFAKYGTIVGFMPALDTSFPVHGAVWVEYDYDLDAVRAMFALDGAHCRGWWRQKCTNVALEYDQGGVGYAEEVAMVERENALDGNHITRGSPQRPCQPEGPAGTHHIHTSFGAAASSPIPLKPRSIPPYPWSTPTNCISHNPSSPSTTMLPTKRRAEGPDVNSTPVQKKSRGVGSDGISSSKAARIQHLIDLELAKIRASSSSSTPQNTQPHLATSTGGVANSVSSPRPAMQNPSSSTSTVPSARANEVYNVPTRNDRTNVPSSNSSSHSQATTSTRTGKEEASVIRNGAGSSASKNAGLPTKGARPASS